MPARSKLVDASAASTALCACRCRHTGQSASDKRWLNRCSFAPDWHGWCDYETCRVIANSGTSSPQAFVGTEIQPGRAVLRQLTSEAIRHSDVAESGSSKHFAEFVSASRCRCAWARSSHPLSSAFLHFYFGSRVHAAPHTAYSDLKPHPIFHFENASNPTQATTIPAIECEIRVSRSSATSERDWHRCR